MEPPNRLENSFKSINNKLVSPQSVLNWGVRVLRTSITGENPVTINDNGEVIDLS